jgi:hypothetical protein
MQTTLTTQLTFSQNHCLAERLVALAALVVAKAVQQQSISSIETALTQQTYLPAVTLLTSCRGRDMGRPASSRRCARVKSFADVVSLTVLVQSRRIAG